MADAKISVRNHGPLRIEGSFVICDQDGNAFGLGGRTAASLRNAGLNLTEHLPVLKNVLMRHAMS